NPLPTAAPAQASCATVRIPATAGVRTDGIDTVYVGPRPHGNARTGLPYIPAMTPPAPPATPPDVLAVLVENHRRFLAFLERRVGSVDEAEAILQDAFVRGLDRADTGGDPGSSLRWCYRLLRNAVVDHHRRRGAEDRALAYAAGTAAQTAPGADEELRD